MEPKLEKVGVLDENPKVGAVVASPDGFALIGTSLDGPGDEPRRRLLAATARIVRADPGGVSTSYEGEGRIVAIDGVGLLWFAVAATLKKGKEPGSNYRLLRSLDEGRAWQDCGPIPAGSVSGVLAVAEREAWVLGARTLGRTDDGGDSWRRVQAEGERHALHERLRRAGEAVALLGLGGIALTTNGGRSWSSRALPGARICDLQGTMVLGVWSDVPGVAELGGSMPFATLADDCEPLRLAVAGNVIRVLSRARDAGRGPEMTIHRSEDGGKSWSHQRLSLTPHTDIAGERFAAGVDLIGGVHVAS